MNTSTRHPGPSAGVRKLALVLALLALLSALFLVPGSGVSFVGPWFWFMLVLVFLLLWSMFGETKPAREEDVTAAPHMLAPEEQPPAVRDVMDVQLAEEERGIRIFRGRLRDSADVAFARLKAAFGAETTPLIRPDDRCGASIVLLPRPVEQARLEHRARPWVNWLLFGLTFLTTTWAGAAQQGVNLLRKPERFAVGLPYSIALLAILGVHELGHYWVARKNGMNVTPPYFVPVPFALGTFGAFIQMRSPAENRRILFDVAVAGPFAGLLIAIPALVIGLRYSSVLPLESAGEFARDVLPLSSILVTFLARLVMPGVEAGDLVQLSPLAFAGWLGLFITGLNLMPIGQLDGGHIARAMFGSRVGAIVGAIAMWSLVFVGLFVWPGLLTWALIIFFIAGRGTPPLNDITPIPGGRLWLGWLAFAILVLVMVPASVHR